MNKVGRTGCFLMLFFAGMSVAEAQNTLFVKPVAGSQTAWPISGTRKLVFSPAEMILTKTDDSTHSYLLSDLRFFSFKDYFTGIGDLYPAGIGEWIAYPNPVKDRLYVDYTGSPVKAMILELLDMRGRALRRLDPFEPGSGIDVASLPAGIYFIRLIDPGESSILKFIKE